MDTYSLNPQILPGKPLTHEEHHRAMVWLVFAVIVLIAAGVFYWYERSLRSAAVPTNDESVMRAKIVELMQQAPVHASQAEIDQIANLMAQSSPPPNIDRNAIINLMKK